MLAIALLVAFRLLAIQAAVVPSPAPPSPADPSLLVTLTRQAGGWGRGRAYELRISADGTVRYEGQKNVGVIGARTKKLTPRQLEQLISAFDAVGYFSLEDKYESGPSENTWTITSFTRGGRTKKVEHYMSDDSVPALRDLELRIDAIVGTQQWVYLPPAEARRREQAKKAKFRAEANAVRARLPVLMKQVADPSRDVRISAAVAILDTRGYSDAKGQQLIGTPELTQVAPAAAEALANGSAEVRKRIAYHLNAFGREAAPMVAALTAALSDPDPFIRGAAAGALYRIGSPAAVSAVPALERALRDTDPEARGEAARALPALGYSYQRVLDILIADLKSPEEPVRFAAATVLGWGGREAAAALPALREALDDPSARVRDAARESLQSVSPAP
jgi:hypothetical protein